VLYILVLHLDMKTRETQCRANSNHCRSDIVTFFGPSPLRGLPACFNAVQAKHNDEYGRPSAPASAF